MLWVCSEEGWGKGGGNLNIKGGGGGGGGGVGEQFECMEAGEKFESLGGRRAGKFPLKVLIACGFYVVCIPNMV